MNDQVINKEKILPMVTKKGYLPRQPIFFINLNLIHEKHIAKVRICGSYANYEPLFSHLITWFSKRICMLTINVIDL